VFSGAVRLGEWRRRPMAQIAYDLSTSPGEEFAVVADTRPATTRSACCGESRRVFGRKVVALKSPGD